MASDDSIASVSKRAVIVGLAALYVAAWTLGSLALKTRPSDLDLYFWPSAETVIGGHPLVVYSAYLRDAYPNANGPLGLVTSRSQRWPMLSGGPAISAHARHSPAP